MIQPLIDAWFVNAAQTIFLLDCLTPEQWEAAAPEAKPIRAQFAHLHNVRLMWVKMSDKSLLGTMEQAARRKGTQAEIRAGLIESAAAIARIFENSGSADGKVKGLSRSAAAFLAGVCAHEGYHRGQIELILRQAGVELDDQKMLHLWDHAKMVKFAKELW